MFICLTISSIYGQENLETQETPEMDHLRGSKAEPKRKPKTGRNKFNFDPRMVQGSTQEKVKQYGLNRGKIKANWNSERLGNNRGNQGRGGDLNNPYKRRFSVGDNKLHDRRGKRPRDPRKMKPKGKGKGKVKRGKSKGRFAFRERDIGARVSGDHLSGDGKDRPLPGNMVEGMEPNANLHTAQ